MWKKKRRKLTKRRSTRRDADRAESTKRKDSGKRKSDASVSTQFTIPKTRTKMLQQPLPEFSQSRMGDGGAEKRIS